MIKTNMHMNVIILRFIKLVNSILDVIDENRTQQEHKMLSTMLYYLKMFL